MLRMIASVVSVGIVLFWTLPAGATDIWSYCYGAQCFDSRHEAEEAMRAEHVNGSLLTQEKAEVETLSGNLTYTRITYFVPDQPPSNTLPTRYKVGSNVPSSTYCPGSVAPENACYDLEEMLDGYYQAWTAEDPDCAHQPYSVTGSWADPYYRVHKFTGTTSGRLDYDITFPDGRYIRWDFTCPNGQFEQEGSLHSWTYFECPVGTTARSGYGPGYAPPEQPDAVSPEQLCRATTPKPIIDAYTIQVECDAANCGPIYPTTGDKARFEPDLEFAGHTFVRSYHSLLQGNPLPAFSPGWTHTYADKLYASASPKILFNDKGYFERFDHIGSGVYRSMSDPDRTLTDLSGAHRLVDSDGTVKIFDSAGRLISVGHPDRPAQAVSLAYDHAGRITAATDATGKVLSFLYDVNGRLQAVQTSDGEGVVYDYDGDGNLVKVTRADASERTYHYGEAGLAPAGVKHLLTGITDENGVRHASFGYDARGRAVLTERHTGNPASPTHDRTTVDYLSETAVEFERANGDVVSQTVGTDRLRRVQSSVDGRGTTGHAYDSHQRRTQTTAPDGTVTKYEYANTYTSAVVEAFGTAEERKTLLARNAWQVVTDRTVQRKDGSTYTTVEIGKAIVDSAGRRTAVCRVDPTSPNAGYSCGSLANAPSGVSQVLFARCDATDVAAPNTTCPILGLLKSTDGPRTDIADLTTYQYRGAEDLTGCDTGGACHRAGDLWKVTDPQGQVTEIVRYDLAGRPTRVLDANGVATDLEYHVRGWLTARKVRGDDDGTETDDAITRLDYDNVGQVVKITQPDGSWLAFDYDDAHRLVGVEDALGNSLAYTLDGAGNRVQEELRDSGNVLRHSLSRVFDQLGQLETLADADATPTDFTYDLAGNPDTITDPFNRVTALEHDPLGRLRQSIANDTGSGNERAVTGFDYDALDRLVAVTDPKGLVTGYTYDGLGNLVELDSPDTGTTTYSHDAAGNVTGKLDARGVQTTYGYDAAGRLALVDVPTAGEDIVLTYDTAPTACLAGETFATGRLARIADYSGTTDYCHDRRGNVVRKVQALAGGPSRTVAYGYDLADRLAKVTYPSGAVVTYQRDAAGRISGVQVKRTPTTAVETLVSAVAYQPFGPLSQLTFGNGRVLDKTFDQNYGIDAVADNAAGGLDLDFTLDSVGNVTGIDERLASGAIAARTVEYDGLDRLSALKDGTAPVEAFSYDATGNRLSKTAGTTVNYTYPVDSHRLSQVGAQARTYDAAGNTVSFQSRHFTYDDHGRLRELHTGATGQNHNHSYRYNGRGERVAKLNVGAPSYSRVFVYDEAGRLLGEYSTNGIAQKEYLWLDDTLVAVLSNYQTQKVQYVLTDHLGTPRAVVSPPTDTIIWRWDLTQTAFGDHVNQTDPDGDGTNYTLPLRYPGQYYDSEKLSHYNYFRDYDPGTGRYLQSDPVGLLGGTPTYSYVKSTPFALRDPQGLDGFGFYGNGTAQAGILSGGAGQLEIGTGIFRSRRNGKWTAGRYTAAGGFVGTNYVTLNLPGERDSSFMPYSGYSTFTLGASTGSGVGFFYTNADCVEDLSGPYDGWSIETPWFSGQLGVSDTGVISIGIGQGSAGFSFSRYRMDTTTALTIAGVD